MSYLKKLKTVVPAILASATLLANPSLAQDDTPETEALSPAEQPVPETQSNKIAWGPFTVGGAIRGESV